MAELSTYDIFISYTDDDSEWVEGFLIPALGVPEERIITREKFRPGADKVVEFERAVTSSCYVLLILSPAFLNDIWLGFGELIASYSRVVQQRDRRSRSRSVAYGESVAKGLSRAKGDRILPLIRESCELPLRLDSLIPCDCTEEAACEHAIVYLRELLAQPEPKLEPIPCPYPGMKPFTPEDSRFFYGREPEIKNLLLHLRKQNYFFVIGPSGSGKSSLVLAGLVAQLEKRQPGQWLVKSIRPGTKPMQALAEALGISGFSIVDNSPTVEQYREWVESLLVGTQPGCRLFLFIDQFEELFSQSNKQDQTTLIAAIESLRQVEHCTLVVAMRADFYPDLMDSNLWPLQGFERIEIAPLHGKRLEEAIAKPAENCGVYIEAKLLERLVNDAADEPGVLPLIQETMVLLWDTMEPRLLTLSAYEKLGQEASKLHPSGLSVAIATHADATLAKLSESQQAIARRVFLRLVQFGEGRPDTRRQQPIDQLITIDDDLNLFNQTLQHLADSRLLTLSGEKNSSKKVDIAHEALIRAWQTLQQWITQRREAEQTRRRLEEKVKEWLRLGGSGGLLDQVELAEAQRWLKSADANALGYNQELLNLVDVSNYQIQAAKRQEEKLRQQALAQERKARQAAQTRTIVVSIALVMVTGLGALVFNQSRNYRMKSLEEMRTSSLLLLSSNQELDALVKAVEAGELLKNTLFPREDTKIRVISALNQVLSTVREKNRWQAHDSDVISVSFSPDGQTIASGSTDTIKLWRQNGKGFQTLDHEGRVFHINFSKDSKILVSASHQIIKIWRQSNGKYTLDETIPTFYKELPIASSPDSQIIALVDKDNQDYIVKILGFNGEINQLCQQHTKKTKIKFFSFSGDGKIMVSISEDGSLKIAEINSCKDSVTIPVDKEFYIVRFVDTETVALGSKSGILELWDWRNKKKKKSWQAHDQGIDDIKVNPVNKKMIASASKDGTIKVWQLDDKEMKPLSTIQGDQGYVSKISFSKSGKLIALGGKDGTIIICKINPVISPIMLKGMEVSFSPDGKILASGGEHGNLYLWQRKGITYIPYKTIPAHGQQVMALSFRGDGKMIASASEDTTVKLWQPDGEKIDTLNHHKELVSDVSFSPKSDVMASASADHTVKLWNLNKRNKPPRNFPKHRARVNSVSFSPKGNIIASVDTAGKVILWNSEGKIICKKNHPSRSVIDVSFSPKGKLIASGTDHGEIIIRLWNSNGKCKLLKPPFRAHKGGVYGVHLIFVKTSLIKHPI